MELNLNHDTLRLNETAYDGALEQAVEHEYQLPDYYPGIFKLLQCRIEPHICACRTSGDQLAIDGVAIVKLMYTDEEEGAVHSLEQTLPFSRSVELKGEANNPTVSCKAAADYCNCRIISPRKIEIRGAVTLRVNVQTQREEMVLCDASGAGIQLNRTPVSACGQQLWAARQFSLSEQLSLDPPAEELLDCRVVALCDSCKLIANKAITKGTAYVHLLYRPAGGSPTVYETALPVSQIVDLPGVDEDYLCDVRYEATSAEAATAQEGSLVNLDADITVNCCARLQQQLEVVTDAYSTDFDLKVSAREMRTPAVVGLIGEQLVSTQSFDLPALKEVSDCLLCVSELAGTAAGDSIHFTARLSVTMLGTDPDGAPSLSERAIPIEFDVAQPVECENPVIEAEAKPIGCSFTAGGGRMELTATLWLQGSISCEQTIASISDVVLDENHPREKPAAALTLYYPDSGDSVWNIAKQFCTSPAAIMQANGLEKPIVSGQTMLMIPIV